MSALVEHPSVTRAKQQIARAAANTKRRDALADAGARGRASQRRVDVTDAKTWTPRREGYLNTEVFPTFKPIPPYIGPLISVMHGNYAKILLAFVVEADYDGAGKIPREWLLKTAGVSEPTMRRALSAFRRAGVLYKLHPGNQHFATVWALVPVAEHDPENARLVLA